MEFSEASEMSRNCADSPPQGEASIGPLPIRPNPNPNPIPTTTTNTGNADTVNKDDTKSETSDLIRFDSSPLPQPATSSSPNPIRFSPRPNQPAANEENHSMDNQDVDDSNPDDYSSDDASSGLFRNHDDNHDDSSEEYGDDDNNDDEREEEEEERGRSGNRSPPQKKLKLAPGSLEFLRDRDNFATQGGSGFTPTGSPARLIATEQRSRNRRANAQVLQENEARNERRRNWRNHRNDEGSPLFRHPSGGYDVLERFDQEMEDMEDDGTIHPLDVLEYTTAGGVYACDDVREHRPPAFDLNPPNLRRYENRTNPPPEPNEEEDFKLEDFIEEAFIVEDFVEKGEEKEKEEEKTEEKPDKGKGKLIGKVEDGPFM
ncbi:hypothetical protein Sste5346_004716 [Sporothrix stenoceras]|uniref:Uncharacterized protein n=1 Tax=Sporothrix stenoceras TaxID=5173 RepID=A0ABR3Z7X6_9PEZI